MCEDTHITDKARIKKLVALLAIAFTWAHRTGEWQNEQKANKNQKTWQTCRESVSLWSGFFVRFYCSVGIQNQSLSTSSENSELDAIARLFLIAYNVFLIAADYLMEK